MENSEKFKQYSTIFMAIKNNFVQIFNYNFCNFLWILNELTRSLGENIFKNFVKYVNSFKMTVISLTENVE